MTKISQAVLLFVLNATWQATMVALLASISDRMMRKTAVRYRHMLWVAALSACVVLTLSSLRKTQTVVTATASMSPSSAVALEQHSAHETAATNPTLESTGATRRFSRRILPQIVMPIVGLSKPLALTIAALYGLLLLYRTALLLKAWGRTRALVRAARTVELSTPVTQALTVCRRGLGLGRVSVLSSATAPVPATAGAMRPVLILPEHLLRQGDIHLLTSALGHEAAHIARRDYLLNLVYEFASLPLWFHPAVRLVLRRIRQTRELCCDEMVTERLLEPRIYAQSLVQLAGAALPFGRPAATITVGIADADILEERIMSILKYSPARLRRRSALLLIASLLFVVPCIAAAPFAVHVAIHQPALAAAIGQPGPAQVAPEPQSTEVHKTAPETITLLTKDGEVTVTTDNKPKVGDVITTADGQRIKIVAIGPQGQYKAYIFKNTGYAFKGGPGGQQKTEADAEEKVRKEAQLQERAERKLRETTEGELSEQELQAHRKRERVELEMRAQRQAELAQQAKIPMDQAIQIALRETPGTVVEARLIGERGGPPTYFVSILQPNSTGSETSYVLVNAVDGSAIVKGTVGKQER